MADNVYEIMIKFGLSKEKATEAANELKKLEEAGKRAGDETGKGAEEANIKFKDLKKTAGLLAHEVDGVGRVMKYIFNPGILGVAVLAKSIGSVWDAFKTFLQGLKDSAVNSAKSIGDIKQAMLELDIERAKADENFKTSMEDFERISARKIEVINLEKDAVLQLLGAREKSDLASAKSPEEQEAIKQRYASARSSAETQAIAKEAAARESALREKEAIAKRRFKEGASSGLSPERVKLALKKMPGEIKSLDEQIAGSEAAVEQLKTITTPAGMLPYWNDPENYKTQFQAYKSEEDTLKRLKATRQKIAGRQVPLTSADTAYDDADTLMKQVRIGRDGLANFQTDSAFKQQTNFRVSAIESGHGAAGELVSSAAAGADALKAGGKATADQSKAIQQVTQLLNLTGQSNEMILNMLGRMNDNQSNFIQSLKTVEQRTKTMSRQQ